jgi:hypothetical protein
VPRREPVPRKTKTLMGVALPERPLFCLRLQRYKAFFRALQLRSRISRHPDSGRDNAGYHSDTQQPGCVFAFAESSGFLALAVPKDPFRAASPGRL